MATIDCVELGDKGYSKWPDAAFLLVLLGFLLCGVSLKGCS